MSPIPSPKVVVSRRPPSVRSIRERANSRSAKAEAASNTWSNGPPAPPLETKENARPAARARGRVAARVVAKKMGTIGTNSRTTDASKITDVSHFLSRITNMT